jgi:hypothetical protein
VEIISALSQISRMPPRIFPKGRGGEGGTKKFAYKLTFKPFKIGFTGCTRIFRVEKYSYIYINKSGAGIVQSV